MAGVAIIGGPVGAPPAGGVVAAGKDWASGPIDGHALGLAGDDAGWAAAFHRLLHSGALVAT
jgi:hypothetical protein